MGNGNTATLSRTPCGWRMQWEVRPLIYEKLCKWRHGHLRTVLHVRVLLRPVTGGGTLCCTVHKQCISLLVGGCVDDLLSDHQYNFLWNGTVLLYPICRKRKRETEITLLTFENSSMTTKITEQSNPTAVCAVWCPISKYPNLMAFGSKVRVFVCCYYYCCCFSFICNHISSYYLERRIRKVMVVLTPWLVKMVVAAAAAIIILIRVC